MQDRIFINSAFCRYSEIIRCDLFQGGRSFAYVDADWGVYFWRDFGFMERDIVLESEIEQHAATKGLRNPRITRIEDASVSVINSKYGSIEEIAEALYRVEKMNGSFSESDVYAFLDGCCDYDFFRKASIGTRGVMHTLLNVHEPVESECGGITIYRNAKDHKRGRRTTMKAGRAFRHIFNSATDSIISEITEKYIEWSKPRVFSFHSGYKAEDFAKAYDGDTARYRNPRVTSVNKSLASSCMQGVGRSVNDNYHSVGEAYASGDFYIAWLEDEKGLIAGRVVIGYRDSDDKFISGPVYGSCEQSLAMLNKHLDDIDAMDAEGCAWEGLSLKVVGSPSDPVVPYLDGDYSGDIIDNRYIAILPEGHGEFEFSNTDGYLADNNVCCSCGSREHPDEVYHSPDGDLLCEHCFFRDYTCTEDGDVICLEESATAFMYSSFNDITYEVVVHIDDCVYIESLDQHWVSDDVKWCSDRQDYYPTHLLKLEEELAA